MRRMGECGHWSEKVEVMGEGTGLPESQSMLEVMLPD